MLTSTICRVACQYSVSTSRCSVIVLSSRSPRKCRYPLFVHTLFEPGKCFCLQDIHTMGGRNPSPTSRPKITTFRKAPHVFKCSRQVMRAMLSVRPKCSHRCVSLKEFPLKPLLILKHATRISAEQTSMRTKCFKHVAMEIVKVHLLYLPDP